jgi:hypothetical protein
MVTHGGPISATPKKRTHTLAKAANKAAGRMLEKGMLSGSNKPGQVAPINVETHGDRKRSDFAARLGSDVGKRDKMLTAGSALSYGKLASLTKTRK